MSVKIMSRVWDHSGQDGSTLLVLLALADHADEDGVCWPGIERVAHKARVSERQAQRIIKTLEDKGELLNQSQRGQKGGRGYTNRYLIATGMSAYEIEQALIKRFEVEPALASRVADYLIDLQNGGSIEAKKDTSNPCLELPWIVCKKGDKQGKKRKRVTSRVKRVTSRDKKGDIAMSPEPSENHQKEPSEDSSTKKKAKKDKVPSGDLFRALAEICQYDLSMVGPKVKGQIKTAADSLCTKGYTPETLKGFESWWYANDWRGKKNQPPNLELIKETWGQYKQFLNGATNDNARPKYDGPAPGNRAQPATGAPTVADKLTAALRAKSRTGGDSPGPEMPTLRRVPEARGPTE